MFAERLANTVTVHTDRMYVTDYVMYNMLHAAVVSAEFEITTGLCDRQK